MCPLPHLGDKVASQLSDVFGKLENMCRRPLLGGPVHKLGAKTVGRRRLQVSLFLKLEVLWSEIKNRFF